MNLSEIIKDAIVYPTNNVKALLIYIVLGFLVGFVAVLTGIGGFLTGSFNFAAGIVLGLIGIIVIIWLLLLMFGFSLDIVKLSINKNKDAPEIELSRQISNGLKYIIVSIVCAMLYGSHRTAAGVKRAVSGVDIDAHIFQRSLSRSSEREKCGSC